MEGASFPCRGESDIRDDSMSIGGGGGTSLSAITGYISSRHSLHVTALFIRLVSANRPSTPWILFSSRPRNDHDSAVERKIVKFHRATQLAVASKGDDRDSWFNVKRDEASFRRNFSLFLSLFSLFTHRLFRYNSGIYLIDGTETGTLGTGGVQSLVCQPVNETVNANFISLSTLG